MTSIHRTPQWQALARKMRPIMQARINAGGWPCANACVMGGVVWPGQLWDLAHIVDAAVAPHLAYDPANVSVSHRRCNRSDGAKANLRARNAKKTNPNQQEDPRTRPW